MRYRSHYLRCLATELWCQALNWCNAHGLTARQVRNWHRIRWTGFGQTACYCGFPHITTRGTLHRLGVILEANGSQAVAEFKRIGNALG